MANQLALRTLLSHLPPYAILADASSHIIHFEAGGVSLLSGAMAQAIRPVNGEYLSLQDVRRHAVLDDGDVYKTPTRVKSLENTTSGNIIPLEELSQIKAWASEHGILTHLYGARLWEAVAAGAGTLRGFAECADMVCLDFSKGLGAPMGAMVLGSRERFRALKRIRKGVGGGMRQAKRIEQVWKSGGGRVSRRVQTNMVWRDLNAAGNDEEEWERLGSKAGLSLDGKRIVTHHQVCEGALERLQS